MRHLRCLAAPRNGDVDVRGAARSELASPKVSRETPREGFRSQREALSGSFDNACEPASAMSRRQLAQAFHEKRERYGNAPTADTRTSTACAGTAFITTLFPVEPMGDTSLESIRESGLPRGRGGGQGARSETYPSRVDFRLAVSVTGAVPCPHRCAHRWTTVCQMRTRAQQRSARPYRTDRADASCVSVRILPLRRSGTAVRGSGASSTKGTRLSESPSMTSRRDQPSERSSPEGSDTSRPMFSTRRSRSSRFVNSRVMRPFRFPTSMRTGVSRRLERRLVRSTTCGS